MDQIQPKMTTASINCITPSQKVPPLQQDLSSYVSSSRLLLFSLSVEIDGVIWMHLKEESIVPVPGRTTFRIKQKTW